MKNILDYFGFCLSLLAAGWPSIGYAVQVEEISSGIKMIQIPAGEFRMGYVDGDWDERPIHKVKMSNSFLMSESEITNSQYEEFRPEHKAWRGKKGVSPKDDEPVVYISWHDAMAFCEWLSLKEGKNYRLPTEAEWEYACRAGTTSRYNTGKSLPETCKKNNGGVWTSISTVDLTVKKTKPNAFGLYDMHGNVEEWCIDWYDVYNNQNEVDPVGPKDGLFKVTRGGSHSSEFEHVVKDTNPMKSIHTYMLSSSNRQGALPNDRNWVIGFRVVQAHPIDEKSLKDRISQIPLNQKNVKQDLPDLTLFPVDYRSDTAYFKGPIPFVIPPIAPADPTMPFYWHNHVPAITEMANGDFLTIWYNTLEEPGRELKTVASRKRAGSNVWEPASLFFDAPDRNEHGCALFWNGKDTVFHFSGYSASNTWNDLKLLMRYSIDNGATWSVPNSISEEYGYGNMPIASVVRDRKGRIILTCDAVPGADGGTVIWVSGDGGKTWKKPSDAKPLPAFETGKKGDWIAGIHATLVERKDGTLLSYGRGNHEKVGWSMPLSTSMDGGETWTYSSSGFPYIGSGQRATVQRMPSGHLILATFARSDDNYPIYINAVDGKRRVYGLFVALSEDGGKTWPYKRLVTDDELPTEYNGWGWQHEFVLSQTQGEPRGYIASVVSKNGLFHLISSGNEYIFNEEWVKSISPAKKEIILKSDLEIKDISKNVIYDGRLSLPNEASNVWKVGDKGGVQEITPEGLQMKVAPNARCRYYQSKQDGFGVDALKGFTIEVKLKVKRTANIRGLDFEAQFGDWRAMLTIGDTYMCFESSSISRIVENLDLKTAQQVIRMAVRPDRKAEIFLNGKLLAIVDCKAGRDIYFPLPGDFIRFGKGAGAEDVDAVIEYLTYDLTGAYRPIMNPSGIELRGEGKCCIYPNPVKNFLYFESDVNKEYTYSVFDINGSLLKNGKCEGPKSFINTTSLETGHYFLQVVSSTEHNNHVFPFIKK